MDPIRSRYDLNIQQATVRSYERCAAESTHQTAVKCLKEAGFFKRKSWFQKVEISKEMVKQHTRRCIRASDDTNVHCVPSPIRATETLASPGRAN